MSTTTDSGPEGFFALPNALTLARVPLAALLWVRPESPVFVLSVIATAALSDAVDGRFARAVRRWRARRRGDEEIPEGSSDVGAFLDPACDKVFVISAVVAVSWAMQPPLAVIALVAVREVGVIPLVFLYKLRWQHQFYFDFRAGPYGKITTVAQFAAIMSMLVAPALTWPLAVLCGVAGVAATADYFYRGWRAGRKPAPQDEPES